MLTTQLSCIFAMMALYFKVEAMTPEAEADKVSTLPMSANLKTQNFGFSGYLDVSDTKHMHYWFFPSTSADASSDPVVFWTNGGPGCSGLLGAFTEQGPFWPQADGNLADNEYAWNRAANMIFVEQPCGVGFSYSSANDTKADYTYDDDAAAKDFFSLIEGWQDVSAIITPWVAVVLKLPISLLDDGADSLFFDSACCHHPTSPILLLLILAIP